MNVSNPQRKAALRVVRKLREAGFEAYWAGGSVRDELLGRQPHDYDIATSARPEQVRTLFGHARTLAIGAAFGVIGVQALRGCEPVEVATFRTDGIYADGRHPDSVHYSDARHDASRRDFTINGLFYDPLQQRVIDYVEGQEDLHAGLIRAIGDPRARYTEDKLRMLRAVRIATTLGFQIEQETETAIREMAGQINIVSAERTGMELRKLLTHPRRSQGVALLARVGLLKPLLPELAWQATAKADEGWRRTLRRLDRLQSDSLSTCLAALLLTAGDWQPMRQVARRLRYSNKEVDRTQWLLESLPLVTTADKLAWPQLQRLLVHEGSRELLALAEASVEDSNRVESHAGLQRCREVLALPSEHLNPPPLISGDDLIAHGLQPGPHFGCLLATIRDAQLLGHLADRQQALEMADAWVHEHKGRGED
jgi:poly(A) polymerase